ncbi:MAG: hypothetical protein KA271_05440 [Propionivibrio sp.]|jgi:hypothetical protein|nr:hypothetical protein [Propionivibrio sp.]
MTDKIPGTAEAWEARQLGAEERFAEAVVDAELESRLDAQAGLKMISLRVPERLIADFKIIALANGQIGYQTLMKQCLKRFVDSELKWMARSMAADQAKAQLPSAAKVKGKAKPEAMTNLDDSTEERRKVA